MDMEFPKDLKVGLAYRIFEDQIMPNGFLTRDVACHACWYFYMIAHTAKQKVGKSLEDQVIEYNTESTEAPPMWMDKRYNAQAKSVAFLYGLDSPSDFQPYWQNVKTEAARLGMPAPEPEYMHLTGKDIIL